MPHKRMSTREYRAACSRLGIPTSYRAAAALGISQPTASRYSSGRAQIAMPVALLLRTMIELDTLQMKWDELNSCED